MQRFCMFFRNFGFRENTKKRSKTTHFCVLSCRIYIALTQPKSYPAPIRKVEFRGANWTANRTNRSVNHESYRAADPLRGTIRGVRFAVHANIMDLWVSLRFVLRYSPSNSIQISIETCIEIPQPGQQSTPDSGSQNHQAPVGA